VPACDKEKPAEQQGRAEQIAQTYAPEFHAECAEMVIG
jgi:hypothetical protein